MNGVETYVNMGIAKVKTVDTYLNIRIAGHGTSECCGYAPRYCPQYGFRFGWRHCVCPTSLLDWSHGRSRRSGHFELWIMLALSPSKWSNDSPSTQWTLHIVNYRNSESINVAAADWLSWKHGLFRHNLFYCWSHNRATCTPQYHVHSTIPIDNTTQLLSHADSSCLTPYEPIRWLHFVMWCPLPRPLLSDPERSDVSPKQSLPSLKNLDLTCGRYLFVVTKYT